MSLLLDVESLPKGPAVVSSEVTAGTSNSAFHRFTSATTSSTATAMTSLANHNINRISGSPNRNYQDNTGGLEAASSPTSSTASESRSPPSVRKRSHSRKDGHDDDDDRETSQTEGENTFAWPTHSTYDEQRQLLGTEEDSSDHVSSDDEELAGANRSEDGDHRKNVWNITKEQLNYYTTQFFSMQENPDGVIPGNQAKEFFEKSSLPIAELRKIWQLSDVTMDGCLSLEEFLTAMHLVVLRRNNITLPDSLPTCLRPTFLKVKLENSHKKQQKKDQLKETDMVGRRRHNKDLYEAASCEETANERLIDDSEGCETSKEDTTDMGQTLQQQQQQPLQQQPSVPIASESETGSVLSSPGGRPTPVNFDFHRPDAKRDPHIVQPVAVRLSPDSPVVQSSDVDDDDSEQRRVKMHRRLHGVGTRDVGYEQLWNAAKDEHEDDDDDSDGDESDSDGDVETRRFGPVSLPAHHHHVTSLQQQQQQQQQLPQQQHPLGLNKKEGTPPPPPPRTNRSHARSSSLDLNRYPVLRQQQNPPPAVPPRFVGSTDQQSATPSKSTRPATNPIPPISGNSGYVSRDARSLQISIHEYRERNSVVARTINELHQEVSDALEERIALEYQLEQLKSFGD